MQFGLPASIQSESQGAYEFSAHTGIKLKTYGSITQSYFPGGIKKIIVR